ncbi:erythromycin esterase-like protein/pyrimidine operon attenuation protein/uracil phosphoribosyltransferase [Saccharothrix tamanrassetensis]|uniref:Erythromycin esterase-like protein/pyrimidine operon attenuation protein/uracil phosphoribosyltransferase n=1 Tax=Saccharothrix tamanrassetensis TaxID=1051531 RepID=A0A841CKP1_9PSEU|nr:erythromycin esterase family protein [Saccharothrix tamanrassetensis]MBB5958091.1 erythromycin esterase-like protein/pyrimidine operon attenuation protein/uracil phosphoribosyltransferase [Saccharothrix tamanrassetensis]
MSDRLFRDRRDAGRVLAGLLDGYRDRDDVIVLGLPRGGVPVAHEVATALAAPLDVLPVRKLGVPDHPDLAMGAVAGGDVVVVDDDIVRGLGITPEVVRRATEREGRELLRREHLYREGRPMVDVAGKTVVLVDDGLATGAGVRAAIQALRGLEPARVVVAVPAAPESTCAELRRHVDEAVCAVTPSPFFAVGESYWDFARTTDEEVRDLLRAAARTRPAPAAAPTEISAIRAAAIPVRDGAPPDDVLFDLVGDARFVLIGEASHGTHEFYAARAHMTRRLIEEMGFAAVAAEADWPDAYRVNRFVRGRSDDATAEESLRGFERFPAWMWRNTDVRDFVDRLREHNDRIGDERARVGFYGLDLYSLHRSADEVIGYLEGVDPEAAARARERYSCFDHSDGDAQNYGYAAAFGAGESCERAALEQLVELRREALDHARRDGSAAEADLFDAEQNARLVSDAERYYRTMFSGRVSSWNLRDRHMADTLDALAEHLTGQRGAPARIVVWAHNSHLGDASATESAARGELNVGQLVRERHGDDCRLIGFTTHGGTVTAADDWGAPADRKRVRPALADSVEELFHDVGRAEFMVRFDRPPQAAEVLRDARLQRAIGVIYRPRTERQSHYFRARVADQFDAVIHLDETRALEPLDRNTRWDAGELPDTYPYAV